MSATPVIEETRSGTLSNPISSEPNTLTLIDLLYNPLILCTIAPFLPVNELLRLGATSQSVRHLIYQTPGVFRHLDLSRVQAAQFDVDEIDHGGQVWRNVQLDENLTEDDFYSGPLRGIFSTLKRRDILRDVQTLILDGLSVTAELCNDIINDPSYSVKILSLRDVKNLNHAKLRGALQYACRPSRPEGAPRLRALYIFGSRDPPAEALAEAAEEGTSISTSWNQKSQKTLSTALQRDGESWWEKKGRLIGKPVPSDWAVCMSACDGLIAFDAVLCQGPRHINSPVYGQFGQGQISTAPGLAIATFAVLACHNCHSAPEGVVTQQSPQVRLPLLAPPPLLSSTLLAAKSPQSTAGCFVARCVDCLRDRHCKSCNIWWCEACDNVPGHENHSSSTVADTPGEAVANSSLAQTSVTKAELAKSCWECGSNCHKCIEHTQRACRKCHGGYCLVHNEGSTSVYCDWCVIRGRGLNRL